MDLMNFSFKTTGEKDLIRTTVGNLRDFFKAIEEGMRELSKNIKGKDALKTIAILWEDWNLKEVFNER